MPIVRVSMRRLIRGILLAGLAACSGGGAGDAPPAPPAPADGTPATDASGRVGSVAAALTSGPDVLMQRNDFTRTAQNNAETTLTLSNVNAARFGKLFTLAVDGYVYAQPLYKAGVNVGGRAHNVVFVATEHDSVYAFDADSGVALWHVSYITPPSVTTEPYLDTGDSLPPPGTPPEDIYPEVGITSTPVIDPSTGTMYVVAKTEENGGQQVLRVHALDITTGADRVPAVVVGPSVAGTGNSSANGRVAFDPSTHQQRPGLLLLNGVVYVGFGSSGDNFSWHGWLVGYRATDLTQVSVWNTTPNGNSGGIWSSGEAPAVDSSGNLYVPTGNGDFDGVSNFGSAVVKLSTASGLAVSDYFAPFNESSLSAADCDIGSGGVILLPDAAGTAAHPHLLATSGKAGTIYLLDRDSMGHFSASTTNPDSQIVQEIFNALGIVPEDNASPFEVEDSYSTPAYWRDASGRDHLYFGGVRDTIKMFNLTSGQLSTSAVTQSSESYEFPGASPAISSNGNTNGVLWAIQNAAGGAVLHAYDATNLGVELYNSNQAPGGRDALGPGVKFAVPTVTNGKVYVGIQSGVAVFGLLASSPVPAIPRREVWLFTLLLGAAGLHAMRSTPRRRARA